MYRVQRLYLETQEASDLGTYETRDEAEDRLVLAIEDAYERERGLGLGSVSKFTDEARRRGFSSTARTPSSSGNRARRPAAEPDSRLAAQGAARPAGRRPQGRLLLRLALLRDGLRLPLERCADEL